MQRADTTAQQTWLREALDQFEQPLVRYAARLLGDTEQARDVVQDTFLRLCRESPEKLNGRLQPWLFAVCRSRALDLMKKEQRMQPLVDALTEPCTDVLADPAEQVIEHEETLHLSQLVGQLTPREQEVVRLKFQQGLSYREIAEVTTMSVSHVGVVLHAAMQKLRQRWTF